MRTQLDARQELLQKVKHFLLMMRFCEYKHLSLVWKQEKQFRKTPNKYLPTEMPLTFEPL